MLLGRTEPYILGTGDFKPGRVDLPFTTNKYGTGSDCWGFAGAWCYQLPRHRPGFNHGTHATVSDDINCDSSIEQAEDPHATDRLFEVVTTPRLGDLLVYPSIRGPGGTRLRIGHVGIVVALCAEWDVKAPQFGLLTVVQCQAAKKPAIMKGPGSGWMFRDRYRDKTDPAWRSRILRVVP